MSAAAETVFNGKIEATRGTAVAADRALYVVNADLPKAVPTGEYVKQSRGTYVANFDHIITKRDATWQPTIHFSFDDIVWWLQLMIKGGVTPTGVGPYVWTFPNSSTDDDLDSATIEAGDNVVSVRMPFGMVDTWEILGEEGKIIQAKLGMVGAQVEDNGLASPADRDLAGSYAHMGNASLYLDDSAGNIGNTEIENALVGFSIKSKNGIKANHTGNGGRVRSSVNRDERWIEVMLDLIMDVTTYTEFTDHYRDGESRFGRLRLDGNGNDQADIDFHCHWEKFETKRDGPTRRLVLFGQSIYDPTLGYDFQMEVTNDEASL